MRRMPGSKRVRSHAREFAALLLIASAYSAVRAAGPHPSRGLNENGLKFSRLPLPLVGGSEVRKIRPVHPSLERIQSWISAVGAGIALNDLDGNGISDDVCYVDTRTDQVIVAPVPGTGARFEAFALPLEAAGYDRSTMAPMGCLPGDF